MNSTNDSWYFDWINPSSALKQAIIKNKDLCFSLHYVKDIISTHVSMFSYKNIERIPDLSTEILELALLFSNFLCFYKDANLGWGLYRYTTNSNMNRYLRPISVTLLSLKGDTVATNVPFKDIIIARDNRFDLPPFLSIYEYLIKLEHLDRNILKITDVACLPLVLTGSKKVINQYKASAKAMTGSEPIIAADDSLLESVKGFDVNQRISPNDVYILKQRYRNECLASSGIYSVEDKRERILKGEQTARDAYVDYVYNDRLQCRLDFIKKLNEADSSLQLEVIESYKISMDRRVKEVEETAKATDKGEK